MAPLSTTSAVEVGVISELGDDIISDVGADVISDVGSDVISDVEADVISDIGTDVIFLVIGTDPVLPAPSASSLGSAVRG